MKKIKSILAFVLSLSICVSMAACGSSDDSSAESKADKAVTTTTSANTDDSSKSEDEPTADDSSAVEETDESSTAADDTDTAPTMAFEDVKAIAEEIIAQPTLDDCEKIMQEKFDVDVSSRDVVEFDISADEHCTVIIYGLKTPIDVFGKDSGDNPLPTVDSISVTSYTTDLVPVAFDIEMTEDKETNDYYSKEVYSGFRRSDIVRGTVEDVINSSYEAYQVYDEYGYRWKLPEENLGIFFTSQTLTGADKEGDIQYSVDFRNLEE
ncbi:hypothetical protein [Ruminococcus sp.]|uniref:hypothetical protein n=1 Tax=Ruminococcus sp. TaxID=41978 RepID=UPI0025D8A35E|nr:hypothetical protein [Ruminococcus sp.]